MTATKAVAALCGAWLIFLVGGWAARELYDTGYHGSGEPRQAYSIDTGEEEAEDAPPPPTFEEVFASADAGSGERVWSKCRACHQLEQGANATGPYLYGIVGREIATVAGFNYSGALDDVAHEAWTPEALDAFLEDPRSYAPGTSMSFNGLPRIEDRANLIAYLDTFGS